MGSKKKWTQEKISKMLIGRNIQCLTNVDTVSQPSITSLLFKCDTCGTEWHAKCDNIFNKNSGCPQCAGNTKMSIDEVQSLLDARKEHITIVGFTQGTSKTPRKGIFKCDVCSNEWKNTLSNVTAKNQGCGVCNKSLGVIGKKWFADEISQVTSQFYCIEFYSEDEIFVKVGITKQPISSRFGKKVYRNYKYTILKLITGSMIDMWEREQLVLGEFSNYKHLPKSRYFSGKHECLDIHQKHNILTFIEEHQLCT